MAEQRFAVALLAAGSSRRFGAEDKLAQSFRGRPLGEHAALAIPRERFDCAWVIASKPRHRCEAVWRECGFDIVLNRDAQSGLGSSLALAAKLAKQARCDALMIALADMPLVPQSHFEEVLRAFEQGALIVSSTSDQAAMPPAIFDAAYFAELRDSSGDTGARDLLKAGKLVECPADWLSDIDTPRDLLRLA